PGQGAGGNLGERHGQRPRAVQRHLQPPVQGRRAVARLVELRPAGAAVAREGGRPGTHVLAPDRRTGRGVIELNTGPGVPGPSTHTSWRNRQWVPNSFVSRYRQSRTRRRYLRGGGAR